jgi:hypothetical protein
MSEHGHTPQPLPGSPRTLTCDITRFEIGARRRTIRAGDCMRRTNARPQDNAATDASLHGMTVNQVGQSTSGSIRPRKHGANENNQDARGEY